MQIMDFRPDFALYEPPQYTRSVHRSMELDVFLRFDLAMEISYLAESGTANE